MEKLTVDVRGVDLRNLRVDLLVANSRNAGRVRPALNRGNATSGSGQTCGLTGNLIPQNGTSLRGSSGSGFGGLSPAQPDGQAQAPAGSTTQTRR